MKLHIPESPSLHNSGLANHKKHLAWDFKGKREVTATFFYVWKVTAGDQALLQLTYLLPCWHGVAARPKAPPAATWSYLATLTPGPAVYLPPWQRTPSSAGHSHHWSQRLGVSERLMQVPAHPAGFGLYHQAQRQQPHTDCETSPHNCIRSDPYNKALVSGSAFLSEPWLVHKPLLKAYWD